MGEKKDLIFFSNPGEKRTWTIKRKSFLKEKSTTWYEMEVKVADLKQPKENQRKRKENYSNVFIYILIFTYKLYIFFFFI